MDPVFDVIVIGGGPAGLTAGLYAARHGLKTLVMDGKKIGGRPLEAHWVENFPGFPEGLTGADLMRQFEAQAARFGAEFKIESVIGIGDLGEVKMVSTRHGYYQARSLIIATGAQRRRLSVPGEGKFKGRGVSYCAICDGPFFKGKRVAVVGSGHEAVEDAMRLADASSIVYAIPGSKGYSEEFPDLKRLRSNSRIELLAGYDVVEIGGDGTVSYVKLEGESEMRLDVDGVFIILEHVPTTSILSDIGIESDEGGCIVVDRYQQTNIPGIFAAGDCTCSGMQIVTAAGDGGRAALSALRYVRSLGE